MKRLLVIALALMPLLCAAQHVVENPDFYGRNTKIVQITRVETTDRETILHVTLNSPNSNTDIRILSSTRLEDRDSYRVFRLRRAEGLKLDRYQTLRNNTANITLVFDRLPDDVSRVDYIEGTSSNDFRVYGIQVKTGPTECEQTDKFKYYYDSHTLVLPNNSPEGINISIPERFTDYTNKNAGEFPDLKPHPETGRGLTVLPVKHLN